MKFAYKFLLDELKNIKTTQHQHQFRVFWAFEENQNIFKQLFFLISFKIFLYVFIIYHARQ